MSRLTTYKIDRQSKIISKSSPKYDELWDRCCELENFYEKIEDLFENELYECDEYNCCGLSGYKKTQLLELLKLELLKMEVRDE